MDCASLCFIEICPGACLEVDGGVTIYTLAIHLFFFYFFFYTLISGSLKITTISFTLESLPIPSRLSIEMAILLINRPKTLHAIGFNHTSTLMVFSGCRDQWLFESEARRWLTMRCILVLTYAISTNTMHNFTGIKPCTRHHEHL